MNENKLYAYFCEKCGSVEIGATRRVGAYHKAPGVFRFETHAMKEAGVYDARKPLEDIKAEVLAQDWDGGVREIVSHSNEIPAGVVVRQPAKVRRWRRYN